MCIIKQVKNVDHRIRANLQISEANMVILGLFPGNVVLLRWCFFFYNFFLFFFFFFLFFCIFSIMECIPAITDFHVLCILWVFTVYVPLMEKSGCWFALTNCVKNTVERVIFVESYRHLICDLSRFRRDTRAMYI